MRPTVLHLKARCYPCLMPTTRHRFSVTETDELASTLDAAAHIWPEYREDRGELLRLVLRWGAERIEQVSQERLTARRNALHALAGSMTGVYPENARQELRDEWPE
jgi:hypothetical protein